MISDRKDDNKPEVGKIASRSGARIKDVKPCPNCINGTTYNGLICSTCKGEGLISNPNPTYT